MQHSTTEIRLSSLMHRVLQAVREAGRQGLTDHELAPLLGVSYERIRKARGRLFRRGLLMRSGRFRLTPLGRAAVVWVAIRPLGNPSDERK